MTKLSVLISCYNQEKIITKTLNELRNFDIQEIEVIVYDDSSSDNSFQIIREYKKEMLNLKVYKTQENCGISKVRNLLMSKSSGKYFCFVDGDDPQKFEYYQKILQEIKTNKDIYQIKYLNHIYDDYHKEYCNTNLINSVLYVVKSSCKEQLLFDENLHWGEDFEFWIRNYDILKREDNFIVTEYDYNRKSTNNSVTKKSKLEERYLKELTLLEKISNHEGKNKYIDRMINHKKIDILVLEILLEKKLEVRNIKFICISKKFKLLLGFIKIMSVLHLSKLRYKLLFKKYNQN